MDLHTSQEIRFSPDKLRACILYFISNDRIQSLGKTKLMKLLYYADFDHFEESDQAITGATYRKFPHGPVPDEALQMIPRLEADGTILCEQVRVLDYPQTKFTLRSEPDFSCLSADEMDTLQKIADRWHAHNGKQIEAATHGEAPWLSVPDFAEIPYELAYYRNTFGEMDLEDEERAAMGIPVGAGCAEWD